MAMRKFGNHKVGGYDSKREARRARELRFQQMDGQIQNLREQVKFILIPAQHDKNGKLLERACAYKADFVYEFKGQTIVEDSKGCRTKDYIIKRKLMLHVHGIRIVES